MLHFRIRSVDMNGYLGRENHPMPHHVGLLVTPVRMEVNFYDGGDFEPEPVLNADGRVLEAARPYLAGKEQTDDANLETMYTCVTESGELLDLMDFELEPVS